MLKLLHPCYCFLFHLVVISGENADFSVNAHIPPPVSLLPFSSHSHQLSGENAGFIVNAQTPPPVSLLSFLFHSHQLSGENAISA